jgi:hypothetical protein
MSYLHTSGRALQSIGMESLMLSSASPPPQAMSMPHSRTATTDLTIMRFHQFKGAASVKLDRLKS